MPAIQHVELRLQASGARAPDVAIGDDVLLALGSPSASLTSGAPTLVIARGGARNDSGGSETELEFRIGGTAYARSAAQHSVFGTPAYAARGAAQLATVVLVSPGASDELEWYGADALSDGYAGGFATALDLSEITEGDGRWHAQTANTNTVLATPTSGYTEIGDPLVVTAPRTGNYVLLVSAEAVVDVGAAAADRVRVRTTQDGAALSGSTHDAAVGFSGAVRLGALGYAWATRVALTASVEYSFAIEADGTAADGNVGWRRIRLHLLEAAAFEDADVLHDVDTAGLTVTAGNVADVSGLSVTMDPPAESDYLLLACYQGQFSAWPRAFFRLGGATNEPAAGFANAAMGTGTATDADMTAAFGAEVVTVASSTTLGLRCEAAAGGTTSLWGTDCDMTGGVGPGAIQLLAIRLATGTSGPLDASATDAAPADDTASAQTAIGGSATDAAIATDTAGAALQIGARATTEFSPSLGAARARTGAP